MIDQQPLTLFFCPSQFIMIFGQLCQISTPRNSCPPAEKLWWLSYFIAAIIREKESLQFYCCPHVMSLVKRGPSPHFLNCRRFPILFWEPTHTEDGACESDEYLQKSRGGLFQSSRKGVRDVAHSMGTVNLSLLNKKYCPLQSKHFRLQWRD